MSTILVHACASLQKQKPCQSPPSAEVAVRSAYNSMLPLAFRMIFSTVTLYVSITQVEPLLLLAVVVVVLVLLEVVLVVVLEVVALLVLLLPALLSLLLLLIPLRLVAAKLLLILLLLVVDRMVPIPSTPPPPLLPLLLLSPLLLLLFMVSTTGRILVRHVLLSRPVDVLTSHWYTSPSAVTANTLIHAST